MKPSEAVSNLRFALTELEKHLPQLDNSHEHVAAAEASLTTIAAQKEQSEQALRSANAALDRAAAEGRDKLAQLETQHNSKLKTFQDQIASAQATLNDLNATVAARRTEHDQILSSMESLRKKLA